MMRNSAVSELHDSKAKQSRVLIGKVRKDAFLPSARRKQKRLPRQRLQQVKNLLQTSIVQVYQCLVQQKRRLILSAQHLGQRKSE